MPKRSVTDREIGLIKAMLARGTKNREIQFYFNRQDRPVNSGRITQVRNGTYGPNVRQASEADLDTFPGAFVPSKIGAVVNKDSPQLKPTPIEQARALFARRSDGRWVLKGGETDEHECKQDFDPKKFSPMLRAIAALSNNKGGFLFLGVSNKDCCVEGVCAEFESIDIAKMMDKVKTYLSPTPNITSKGVIDLDGRKVGFIHVEPHLRKPVIVCRDDGDKLNEGEILFRYAGQSTRIKFGDLRDLLAERDRRAQGALALAAGKVATVGTANALILDTDRNVLDTEGREILIDEELARSLNFIREGHFDEKEGEPTLKLVGEVRPINVQTRGVERVIPKAISQDDILNEFLEQHEVRQPLEYIFATVSQPRLWLPIFYFARLSGMTNSQIAAEVQKLKTSQKGKQQNVIDRLTGKKTAFKACFRNRRMWQSSPTP
jgi:Putative DNA-binding domain